MNTAVPHFGKYAYRRVQFYELGRMARRSFRAKLIATSAGLAIRSRHEPSAQFYRLLIATRKRVSVLCTYSEL